MSLSRRQFMAILLAITFLGALLRLQGLAHQPPLHDDVLAALTAKHFVEHGQQGPTMPYHPNARNWILYASHGLMGTGAFGLRAASLLFGIASIPLLAWVVSRLTANSLAALLAATFLALDPVHITFSRQAIQEVHTPFFFLAGVGLVVESMRTKSRLHLFLLPLSGVFFGLSIASKSHGLFPLAICFVWAVLENRDWPAKAWLAMTSLTLLPLSVYLWTYLPWFQRGYGIGDWIFQQRSLWATMIGHQGNPMDTLVDTTPILWFLKPFMGYGDFTQSGSELFVTVSMGNPLVWLLVIPAAVTLFRRPPHHRLLQALFWSSYLPLALTTRPVWILSSLAVTPFAYGLLGCWLSRLSQDRFKASLGIYLAGVLAVTLLLYPACIGKGWDAGYLRPLVQRLNPHGGGPP